MKYLLEYNDKDLHRLLGDLEEVGLSEVYRGTLWATLPVKEGKGINSDLSFCFLRTDKISPSGEKQKDLQFMLEKIKEGKFERPGNPEFWSSLEDLIPQFSEIFSPKFIRDLSQSCISMDSRKKSSFWSDFYFRDPESKDSLLPLMEKFIFSAYRKKFNSDFLLGQKIYIFGFLGPENSPLLSTSKIPDEELKSDLIRYLR